jgi:polyphosphate kinase 2 (PPK2 family)
VYPHGCALPNAALYRKLRIMGIRDPFYKRKAKAAAAGLFAAGFIRHVKGLEYAPHRFLGYAAAKVPYLYRIGGEGEKNPLVRRVRVICLCRIVHKVDEQGLDKVRVAVQRPAAGMGDESHATVGKAFLRVLPHSVKQRVNLAGPALYLALQRDKLQKRLEYLHSVIYNRKIPVIIIYEGWDAAGKGGNIKRVSEALDPRGYVVNPIAAPDREELAHHYLWRFWRRLPKDGHIAIFDRSWYGRVMVERIEGFCTENEWKRAYREMNEFEAELRRWGAVIVKFWVDVDKDEQLKRFKEREENPQKRWKITDEDWRNREKWELYESAVDEMFRRTTTEVAEWTVLESNDKLYARIKALEVIISAIEKNLSE